MDTSVYANASTSGNNTYDVSVNLMDERLPIHFTKEFISEMTFDTLKKREEWYKRYSLLMGFRVAPKKGLKRQLMKTKEANASNDP